MEISKEQIFQRLEKAIDDLFLSLNINRIIIPLKEIQEIRELEQDVKALLSRHQHHLQVKDQIQETQAQIRQLNLKIAQLIQNCSDAEFELQQQVILGQKLRETAIKAQENPIDLEILFNYARKISPYTHPRSGKPPIPQEDVLRTSCLFRQNEFVQPTKVQDMQIESAIEKATVDLDFFEDSKKHQDQEQVSALLDLDL
jgi:hypothetical protein